MARVRQRALRAGRMPRTPRSIRPGEYPPVADAPSASSSSRHTATSSENSPFTAHASLPSPSSQNRAVTASPLPSSVRRWILDLGESCVSPALLRGARWGPPARDGRWLAAPSPPPPSSSPGGDALTPPRPASPAPAPAPENDENAPPAIVHSISRRDHTPAPLRPIDDAQRTPTPTLPGPGASPRGASGCRPARRRASTPSRPDPPRALLPPPPPGKRDALCVVLDLDETLVCAYNADAVPSRLSDPRVAARHRTFGLAASSSSPAALVADGAPRPGIAFGATDARGRTRGRSGALGVDPGDHGGWGATPPGGAPGVSAAVAVVVFVRPGLARFLDAVAEFAETVVFTAGAEGYARPLCDVIDPSGRVDARLYRDACVRTPVRDHVKDLAALGRDPRRTVLVDNNPFSFLLQPDNGVPCVSFAGDPEDRQLEGTILPLLRNLAAAVERGGDVRPMLRRRFDMEAWFARHFRAAGIDFAVSRRRDAATHDVDAGAGVKKIKIHARRDDPDRDDEDDEDDEVEAVRSATVAPGRGRRVGAFAPVTRTV